MPQVSFVSAERRYGYGTEIETTNLRNECLEPRLDVLQSRAALPVTIGGEVDTFGLHQRVRLNASLASVISIVDSADARPTAQARTFAEEYIARIDTELDRLKALLDHDLGTFNGLVSEAGLPPVDTP